MDKKPHRERSSGLFTDLYQLIVAQAYWQSGLTAPATFSLFFRNYPPDRAYFVFACLPDQHKALRSPSRYQITISQGLDGLRAKVTAEVKARGSGGVLCYTLMGGWVKQS